MCRTKDAGGIALACATFGLTLYGALMANTVYIFFWHYAGSLQEQFIQGIPLTGRGCFYSFWFNGLVILALTAHLRAAFSDPGRIQEGMTAPFQSEYSETKNCEKCTGKATWKPERAHHCRECGFCIHKMDHHCPWVNNCVGYRNMKYFLQFVLYIMLSSSTLSLFMMLSFYNLLVCKDTKQIMRGPWYPYCFIGSIIAFVEGLLFAYFTWELLSE